MAKKSASELSEYINGLDLDDDVKISLMEDVTDSISPEESEELNRLKDEVNSYKEKYEEVKEKYKERFYSAVESDKKEDIQEELQEKEVIDIREI